MKRVAQNHRILALCVGLLSLSMLVFASVALADQPVVGSTLSAKRAHRGTPRMKRHQVRRARSLVRRPVATQSNASPSPEGLLFSGSKISDFADNQSAPGAVTEVPDPAGSGEKVLKMTVANDDVAPVTPTHDPRAQLVTPAFVEPGEETWWKSRFYLPKDFPSNVPGWVSIVEGPYGPPFEGTPPVSIGVNEDEIRFQRGDTYDYDVAWQEPLERGRWIEVLLHTKFGHNGFVELWIDGQQITFFENTPFNPLHEQPTSHLEMQTMDHTNDGGPNFFVLQNYREHNMFNSLTVYHGPTEVGTTRASVEG